MDTADNELKVKTEQFFFLQMWHRVWKIFRKIFFLMDYVLSSPSEYFLTPREVLIRFNSGMENWGMNHFNSSTFICGGAGSRRQGNHLGVCLPVQQQKSNAFCFQALVIKYMKSSQGFENFTPNTILENTCFREERIWICLQ